MSPARPFKVLGIQQIAIGGPDKMKLQKLWVDLFGLQVTGTFKSERENVDEDICALGEGPLKVEVDLMQPLDPEKKPAVHATPLNHVGLWVDDLPQAVDWLTAQGVRFAPGGIRRGGAGFDGGGRHLPRELLPATLAGASVPFDLGHLGSGREAFVLDGQVLALPEGTAELWLLAAAADRALDVDFAIAGRVHRRRFPGWREPLYVESRRPVLGALRDEKVRPGRKTRHNWLLIKEKDEVAKRGKAGEALEKEVTSIKTGRTLEEIAAKSSKVWHSNRSVDDNVKAGAVAAPKKKAARKTVKKKTRVKKKTKKKASAKRATRSRARR